jgi:hypothetical protein
LQAPRAAAGLPKAALGALIQSSQAHLLKRFSHATTYHLPGEMLRAQAKGDIFKDAKVGEMGVVLKDITNRAFLRRDGDALLAIKIGDALERYVPVLRMEQTGQESQDGALTRAALAEQNSRLARVRAEI